MSVTVFLAEDHQIVRHGLRALLVGEKDLKLVGEAGTGVGAVRLVDRLKPDILVLDLMLPDLSGLEVARQARQLSPRTKVIVLSMHSNAAYVSAAMQAGASAYILKEAGSEHLLRAIREVLAGRQYFSPPLSADVLHEYRRKAGKEAPDPFEKLTARERLVMELSAEGLSSAEVGHRLYISPRTVETHRANLMRKLGVRNLKELIRLALQHDTKPPETR